MAWQVWTSFEWNITDFSNCIPLSCSRSIFLDPECFISDQFDYQTVSAWACLDSNSHRDHQSLNVFFWPRTIYPLVSTYQSVAEAVSCPQHLSLSKVHLFPLLTNRKESIPIVLTTVAIFDCLLFSNVGVVLIILHFRLIM